VPKGETLPALLEQRSRPWLNLGEIRVLERYRRFAAAPSDKARCEARPAAGLERSVVSLVPVRQHDVLVEGVHFSDALPRSEIWLAAPQPAHLS